MNNYSELSYYISYVVLPNILAYEILYLYKHNGLDISFYKLTNKIKKIINIRDINYLKIKYITNNILITKYNYKIISWSPITLLHI